MATRNSRTFRSSLSSGSGARSFVKGVSTYVQPAATGTSNMERLGKALQLGASVADRKAKLDNEADKQRGLIEGLTLSAAGDPAKIKAGEMYPQESQAFMMGLRESQSKAWAFSQMTQWQQEYEQWGDRDSNDPAAFQSWMAGKLGDARDAIGGDQFAIAGAMPILQQSLNNMTVAHAAYTKDRVIGEENQAMRDIVGGMADSLNTEDPKHPSYDPDGELMMAAIDNEVGIRVKKGLDGTKAKQQVLDDLLDRADAMDDPRLYEALANAHDKGIFKLNPDQMKQVEDAHHDYENEMDSLAADEAKAQAAAKKAAENAALADYTMQVGQDGQYPLPPEGLKANPELYKSMLGMRKAMLSAKDYVDPRVEQAAMGQIWAKVYSPEVAAMGTAAKMATISNFINSNPDIALSEGTMGSLMRELGDPKSANKVLVQNATYKNLHTATIKTVKAAFDTPADMFGEGGDNRLSAAFEGMMSQMTAALPEPKSPLDAKETYNEMAEFVSEQILLENPDLYQRLTEIDPETGRMVTQLPPASPIYKAVQDMRSREIEAQQEAQVQLEAQTTDAAAELSDLLGNTDPVVEAPAPAPVEVPEDLTVLDNEALVNLVNGLISQSR